MPAFRPVPKTDSLPRREFLGRALAGAAGAVMGGTGGAVTRAGAGAPVDPLTGPMTGLATYQVGPQFWVRWDNRIVTCYRAHRSQKFPYLYPLAGPASGLSLTAESSLPYPHHRSAYFGCDRVNGGNYWQEGLERGQIQSTGPSWGEVTPTSVELRDECEWRLPGAPVVMKDARRIRVTVPGPRWRFIDWDLVWTAVVDVTIPKTNHSLFSIRGAEDIVPTGGGTLINAEGATGEKGTFGKPSAWCAFQGRRLGGIQEGIALFDHPANPWSPCPWFTRDYGFLSPTPLFFREQPYALAAGQSVRLRYRLVLFEGTLEQAELAARYREWAG